MGSYIWSGNALPVPKVEVSIPNYTPIIGKGLISIKGNFAHGWFGNADSVKNYWLHQKSFYARVGRSGWKVKFYGGFNHQVQWGGRPSKPFYDPISNQTISEFGSDFATFVKVATGLSLGKGTNDWTSQTGIPANEASNRSGNHLGTVDIGLEFYLNKSKVFIYRQNIYEDGSLYYLNNINDGLQGLSIKFFNSKTIQNICFEMFNSTSQGGKVFNDIRPELRGLDNYQNNSLYKDSWTYKGNTIGNPLFTPNNQKNIPNNNNRNLIVNNSVRALGFYFNYRILNIITLNSKLLRYTNFGFQQLNFRQNQISFCQNASFRFLDFHSTIRISSDFGEYWKNNLGIQFNLYKYITL
jgi:hypothetical protein